MIFKPRNLFSLGFVESRSNQFRHMPFNSKRNFYIFFLTKYRKSIDFDINNWLYISNFWRPTTFDCISSQNTKQNHRFFLTSIHISYCNAYCNALNFVNHLFLRMVFYLMRGKIRAKLKSVTEGALLNNLKNERRRELCVANNFNELKNYFDGWPRRNKLFRGLGAVNPSNRYKLWNGGWVFGWKNSVIFRQKKKHWTIGNLLSQDIWKQSQVSKCQCMLSF